jgi:hypothetical protein
VIQQTVTIDVQMPIAFLPAQQWYPHRELLEKVAQRAVNDYIRNVTELHRMVLEVNKNA